ncbi:MAG: type II toxin-antitoxin system prevent-host-death family antitoxin [Treponema sp.]|nr:type II toxin-antitoxin system prevent-host-death family antitoxin [Treponema sp.]
MKDTETIPIHEAKSNLSKLVKRAAAGETIYIGAYGKPEVALMAVNSGKVRAELRKKAFGCMKEKMVLHEGWDDPLPDDIVDAFYSMEDFEDVAVAADSSNKSDVADKSAAGYTKATAKPRPKSKAAFSKTKVLKKSRSNK